ncbi:hypothetical protein AC478_02060 [miscellaneous Crenarchaeota group-1 archaeon SG8-32-3]|uniref:Uncharacterized protein n=1 Tax=miscellaneous Crenarchaeota group-1 archaeon SG8-32-3 TaxID=1685125 RepID=A0A0M0BTA0_9ARCH|nr:MAG: hypothetical protein AC478_02060 [miscellaneous Crenarchaeota group-1 archaeon SG8-32-3]
MDQKTIAIVVIAVVIVAVIGGAAYWMLGTGTTEPEPTPTPTPVGIEGASSLEFVVSATEGESAGTAKYYAKNIGTDDMMIRIEFVMDPENLIYIVNGATEESWGYEGGAWVDYSDTYADQWAMWEPVYQAYVDQLSTWTSGDWTYTDSGGATVTISYITVNPTLEDSFFEGGA